MWMPLSQLFQQIGSQQVKEGQLLQFTVLAVDPEGDVITYEAAGLPRGALFDPVKIEPTQGQGLMDKADGAIQALAGP